MKIPANFCASFAAQKNRQSVSHTPVSHVRISSNGTDQFISTTSFKANGFAQISESAVNTLRQIFATTSRRECVLEEIFLKKYSKNPMQAICDIQELTQKGFIKPEDHGILCIKDAGFKMLGLDPSNF